MDRRKVLVAGAILMWIILIGVWAYWEVYKAHVDWSKRSLLFPSPFYLWWWPCWAWVDFAISLIVFGALGQMILLIYVVVKNNNGCR